MSLNIVWHSHRLTHLCTPLLAAVRLRTFSSSMAAKKDVQTLGDRMKGYEREFQHQVNPARSFLVRLDGHTFSKFTSHFKKPYDARIQSAMVCTASDLVERFNAASGYVASDEITLVFPARFTDEGAPKQVDFGGKHHKILSLTAGLASARFNHHLQRQAYEAHEDKLRAHVDTGFAHFDSRLFEVPRDPELVHNLIWRVRDTRRNSKSMLGQAHYSSKFLRGKSSNEIIQLVKEEKGIDWHSDISPGLRSGVLIKRRGVMKECVDGQTGNTVVVERRELCAASWDEVEELATSMAAELDAAQGTSETEGQEMMAAQDREGEGGEGGEGEGEGGREGSAVHDDSTRRPHHSRAFLPIVLGLVTEKKLAPDHAFSRVFKTL
eukprot:TRINITY_DN20788_c0_g1_i1.p1 TRINITY_DN20788_c0_g1~~TRINITY_DN20788_c0_g1_i1.p1  ORF type:complete len:380 (+),score=90.70 TRINITY_DN20788_c0_g1_i1:27-1166(+)